MIIFKLALHTIVAFAVFATFSFPSTASEEWVNSALAFSEKLKQASNTNAYRTPDEIELELSALKPLDHLEAYQQLSFLKLFDFRLADYQSFKERYTPLLLDHGKVKHRNIQQVLDIFEKVIPPGDVDEAIYLASELIESNSLVDEAHTLAHVVHVYALSTKRNIPSTLKALRQARNDYVLSDKTTFASLALELVSAYTYQQIQDYAKSTESYKRAYDIIERFGYLYFNSDNYLSNLSYMFRQTDQLQHALDINKWQLDSLSDDKSNYYNFFVYFACGVYEQINDNFERSFECFSLAEKYLDHAPARWEQFHAGIIIASLMTNRVELAKNYHLKFVNDSRTKNELGPLSRMQLAKAYLDIEAGNTKTAILRLNTYFVSNANRQLGSFRKLSMEYNTYLDTEIEALERNVSLQNRLLQQQSMLNIIGVAIIIGLVLFTIFLLKSRRKQRILATHDSLTTLYNRRGFLELLSKLIDKANRENSSMVLGMLDIDRFKAINEVSGHSIGDRVLKATALRLKETLGKEVIVGRMGGDEFAFLVPKIVDKTQAEKIGKALCESLSIKIQTGNVSILPSVSIGLASYPESAKTAQQLIDCADFSLRLCKEFDLGSARLFSSSDQSALEERRNVEAALANASEDEFSLQYQPIVDARTGQVTGFEALARWHSAELGMVSPADFIPIAEQTGHINNLSRLLLTKALAEAVNWPKHITLSFNLSSQDVNSLENAEKIKQIVSASSFPNNRLIAELTETAIIRDTNTTRDALRLLTGTGISIALDDFGTGYSSVNHLLDFEFERIKLDRVLIDSIENDQNKFEIVRTLVELCHNLKIDCVIEGVETEVQKEQLHRMKVDKFQGYLFSKPLPADEVSAFLASNDILVPTTG